MRLLLATVALAGCAPEAIPAAATTATVTLHADLEPGAEVTWCQYVLPGEVSPDGLWVAGLEHETRGVTTHHVIWYQMAETPASVANKRGPFRCDGGVHLRKRGILYAPPSGDGRIQWPDGVAARLGPQDVTLIEWHVLNPGTQPASGHVTVRTLPPTTATPIRAGTLLLYDWFVYVPPQSVVTSRMRCRIQSDATLMWASQHMHKRGVAFEARLLDRYGAPVRELLHTTQWDADPVPFPEGVPIERGQLVEFTCSWANTGTEAVIEGDAAGDEMCMFVGGYFPAIDRPFGETCEISADSGPVFGGTATCAESLACLSRVTSRVEAHACWFATRAEDSAALVELAWSCASARCSETCTREGFTPSCLTCLSAQCADAAGRCTG